MSRRGTCGRYHRAKVKEKGGSLGMQDYIDHRSAKYLLMVDYEFGEMQMILINLQIAYNGRPEFTSEADLAVASEPYW